MIKSKVYYLLYALVLLLIAANTSYSQAFKKDTLQITTKPSEPKDSSVKALPKKHIPRIATLRSTFCPGLGQIYNKEYWKLPIVYGALAIPTYTFFYNNHYYNITKYAYEARFKQSINPNDTTAVAGIDPLLKNLSLNSLLNYRNSFRKDRDYSVMWFVILWGLNIVDATVFANLKEFNVSDNLAIKLKPCINPGFSINDPKGIGLSLNLKRPERKIVDIKY